MQRKPFPAVLRGLYDDERARLPAQTAWFDAHTHVGRNDPDGMTGTVEELFEDLDGAGHERALVFAMHEPGGYAAPNALMRSIASGSGGRLHAFARVDPNAPEALDDARRGLEEGARGFKLHPRSDAFGLPHPVVDELAALADEARVSILVHAGRGIPHLGVAATDLARRHPGARLILAHAGISDLGWIAPSAAELPNLLFDTAWWQVSDLLTLFATVPPGNILYGSDSPYGRSAYMALAFLRVARAAGLEPATVAEIAGGQLARIIDGGEPRHLGAPPATLVGERRLGAERGLAYAGAATQQVFGEQDATEAMALARLACQTPADRADPALQLADELLAAAERARASASGERWPGGEELLAAQIVAGTAALGV